MRMACEGEDEDEGENEVEVEGEGEGGERWECGVVEKCVVWNADAFLFIST